MTPDDTARLEALRDAVREYDYLRRECPAEARRDVAWAGVLAAFAVLYPPAALIILNGPTATASEGQS